MKKYVIESVIAAILVAGIFTGCHVTATRHDHVQPQPHVQYVEPSVEYYWVHDGRVYQRDRPGHFYVFEGGRRGPEVHDTNFTVTIEREGRQFGNYNEADDHRKHNKGNQGRDKEHREYQKHK